jgi:uncharacterized protein YgiM (DUF1202 family)
MRSASGSSSLRDRTGGRPAARCVLAGLLGLAGILVGCGSKNVVAEAPTPPPVPAPKQEPDDRVEELGRQLEQCRADLEPARAELAQAREDLRKAHQQAAAAEEHYERLRVEADRTLDEVLASRASLRGVNNQALATSRIAEARVQMQGVRGKSSPEAAARLRDAQALLAKADGALKAGNYGGAAYLADRAAEAIGQANRVAEVASRETGETAGLIPIVPPRMVEVAVAANLRSGPGTTRPRVGQARPGAQLRAVARLGEWLEVESGAGGTTWIHRDTLR